MNKLAKVLQSIRALLLMHRRIDEVKINQGRILAEMHRVNPPASVSDCGFKVFSQWDEDGIIQALVARLPIANRSFIEFGVEDFSEANCRFLLMKDNWSGFVIDGSERNMQRLRDSYFHWQHPLQCRASFITRENVAALLDESGFGREPGILSVDIDGVDYHVLQALAGWRPSILIVEYNGVFGNDRPVSVPYDAAFQRTRAHHSNLYYGANLPAFMHLAGERGYSLVALNGVGSNAFFVRDDLLNAGVRPIDARLAYRDSSFREGRDAEGRLTFLSGAARRKPIAHLPLVDVSTGQTLSVSDLGA